ncbi:hypothetical protein FLP10_02135 [Agromyces intestinalis]|uniref:DUF4149 domain-containing protein n=1 Tax=Agromyces intestinalis TaxID=2592652 RepID=A0A5C1YD75_9MICO|nr:hypothetical protein [Agromyces intestinalis]QEO13345.1 hypothetical protein FLP10_02135 [Agromyces intestinalis]
MPRWIAALRIVLPVFWIGALVALSFLETPLKFQAPGITIPLGLGIGRIMFTALAILGGVVLVATTLVHLRPRPARSSVVVLAAIWLVYLVETFAIRPALSVRTDAVIAGEEAGGSSLHYVYIAADVTLLALLVALVVVTCRAVLPAEAGRPVR